MTHIKTAEERVAIAGTYTRDDMQVNTATISIAKYAAMKEEAAELRAALSSTEDALDSSEAKLEQAQNSYEASEQEVRELRQELVKAQKEIGLFAELRKSNDVAIGGYIKRIAELEAQNTVMRGAMLENAYANGAQIRGELEAQPIEPAPTRDEIFKLYCEDKNAGDWHRPQENYTAGYRKGFKDAKQPAQEPVSSNELVKQEPVAWWNESTGGFHLSESSISEYEKRSHKITALYVKPATQEGEIKTALICEKCGTDRFKEPCPPRFIGNCGIVVTARPATQGE